jgi:integrase
MATAHLIRRVTARGVRWQVRFRWRRSDAHARYFATFERKRDAEVARQWVLGEIAAGRFPEAERFWEPPEPSRTVAEVHDAFVESRRHEVGDAARKQYRQAAETYGALAEMDPARVTVAHCRAWVGRLADDNRKRGTIAAYRSVLRRVLDFADLPHPNPARDPRVKLPRDLSELVEPPSWATFCALRDAMTDRWQPALIFYERTGLRISEGIKLDATDVSWDDGLLRVRGTKTAAARRWVPLLPDSRAVLEDALPTGVRRSKQPVFPGLTANALRSAMRAAGQRAGLETVYTPHDLRHRMTTLLVMAGVPATLIRLIMGHARIAVTLDTHSHVLLDKPRDRLRELRDAAYRIPGVRPIEVGESPEAQSPGDPAVTGTADEGGH